MSAEKTASAIIFDMDGVLVDSEIYWKQVASEFLQGMVPHWNDEHQRSIIGLSVCHLYDFLVAEHGLGLSREEFIDRYSALSEEIYANRSQLIPGSKQRMIEIHQQGIPVALASSAPRPWIEKVVDRFELAAYLQVVVSSDDVGARGKPAPDVYLHTAQQLALPPAVCVAIEDSAKGVQSAKAAGLRCVGFRNGFNAKQDLSAADLVVEGFEECTLELLQSL